MESQRETEPVTLNTNKSVLRKPFVHIIWQIKCRLMGRFCNAFLLSFALFLLLSIVLLPVTCFLMIAFWYSLPASYANAFIINKLRNRPNIIALNFQGAAQNRTWKGELGNRQVAWNHWHLKVFLAMFNTIKLELPHESSWKFLIKRLLIKRFLIKWLLIKRFFPGNHRGSSSWDALQSLKFNLKARKWRNSPSAPDVR